MLAHILSLRQWPLNDGKRTKTFFLPKTAHLFLFCVTLHMFY